MEQYVLHVTRECNMRCKYCYETDRDTTYTTDEILSTCDNILKCNDFYSVEFIGGEPFLEFDHIITAYEYIKERSKKVNGFTISTNLSLLNDFMLDWLEEREDIRLSVSLDGNSYMNQLRISAADDVGTYKVVMRNIKWAMERLGDKRVGVHMTMHPYNVGYLFDGVKHLYDNGVRHIGIGIIETTIEIGAEFAERYIHEMNRVSKTIAFTDTLKGLHISELEGLKPESDQRIYVYDETGGKIIFESYGRAEDDSITNAEVNSQKVNNDVSTLIHFIRKTVYNIHESRMKRLYHEPISLGGIDLTSVPKAELDKGRTIDETLEWMEENFPHECDIHTARTSDTLYSSSVILKANKAIKFNGKGITENASVVSALAEVIERLSSMQFPMSVNHLSDNPHKLLDMATFKDMEEYVGPDIIKMDHPVGLEEGLPTRYVKGYSLLEEKPVGINLQVVSMQQASNGLASGNSYEEAITQAACEVFERFCLYHSAMEKVRMFPTIDPTTIENEVIQSHLQFFDENNYSVYIKDVGYDVFPVMGVYFINNNKPDSDKTKYSYICAGSFNSDICLTRCFTEKIQIGINTEGATLQEDNPMSDLADGGRTSKDLSNLMGGKVVPYVPFSSDNILNDIYDIKTICYELGVDLYIIDFNKYGFPVVYTVIPELSSMDRFRDGRATDVVNNAKSFDFLLGDVR